MKKWFPIAKDHDAADALAEGKSIIDNRRQLTDSAGEAGILREEWRGSSIEKEGEVIGGQRSVLNIADELSVSG